MVVLLNPFFNNHFLFSRVILRKELKLIVIFSEIQYNEQYISNDNNTIYISNKRIIYTTIFVVLLLVLVLLYTYVRKSGNTEENTFKYTHVYNVSSIRINNYKK